MKKIIFIVILFSGLVLSQQPKVVYNEVYQTETAIGNKDDILKISSYGYIIKSEGDNIFLLDKNKNFEELRIVTKSGKTPRERKKERAIFSTNDRYLCIYKSKNNTTNLEIYDTNSKKSKEIKNEEGDIVSASVFDMENILYQTRNKGEEPKIFLIKDNKKPSLIAEGIGEMWSPNGKWFIVKESKSVDNDPTGMKKTVIISFFNSLGQKVMETSEFGIVNWIRWSPTSDKLLIDPLGGNDFYLIYLKDINGKLSIDKKYHFQGFIHAPEKNMYYGVNFPEWSPDGSKISFLRMTEDGHISLDENVWILEDISYSCYAISDFKNAHISNITWSQSGEIYVIKETRDIEKIKKEIIKISERKL